MKVGQQHVELEGISQVQVRTSLLGAPMFGTRLTVVGSLDPYQQQPFMDISETGFATLDGQHVYIGDAKKLGEDKFRYVLVTRDLLPKLTKNEMEE